MTFRRSGWLLVGVNLGFAYLNLTYADNYGTGTLNVVGAVAVLWMLLRD